MNIEIFPLDKVVFDGVPVCLGMERHLAKKARRSSKKNHLKGSSKRTPEDNRRFEESFERLIQKVIG